MVHRSGHTLVELLIGILIAGILAGMGTSTFKTAVDATHATAVVADLHIVRMAVHAHSADKGRWPADAYRGRIPTTLRPYLPEGFSFATEAYTLDYDNWVGRWSSTGTAQGSITVYMAETDLGKRVEKKLEGSGWTDDELEIKVKDRSSIAR